MIENIDLNDGIQESELRFLNGLKDIPNDEILKRFPSSLDSISLQIQQIIENQDINKIKENINKNEILKGLLIVFGKLKGFSEYDFSKADNKTLFLLLNNFIFSNSFDKDYFEKNKKLIINQNLDGTQMQEIHEIKTNLSSIEENINKYISNLLSQENIDLNNSSKDQILNLIYSKSNNLGHEIFLFQIYGGIKGWYNNKIDLTKGGGTKNSIEKYLGENFIKLKFQNIVGEQSNKIDFKNGINEEFFNKLKLILPISNFDISKINGIANGMGNYKKDIFTGLKKLFGSNGIDDLEKIDNNLNLGENSYLVFLIQLYGALKGNFKGDIDGKYTQQTKLFLKKFFDDNAMEIQIIKNGLESKINFNDGFTNEEYLNNKEFIFGINKLSLDNLKNNSEKETIGQNLLNNILDSDIFKRNNYNQTKILNSMKSELSLDENKRSYESTLIQLYGITNGLYLSRSFDGVYGKGTENIIRNIFDNNEKRIESKKYDGIAKSLSLNLEDGLDKEEFDKNISIMSKIPSDIFVDKTISPTNIDRIKNIFEIKIKQICGEFESYSSLKNYLSNNGKYETSVFQIYLGIEKGYNGKVDGEFKGTETDCIYENIKNYFKKVENGPTKQESGKGFSINDFKTDSQQIFKLRGKQLEDFINSLDLSTIENNILDFLEVYDFDIEKFKEAFLNNKMGNDTLIGGKSYIATLLQIYGIKKNIYNIGKFNGEKTKNLDNIIDNFYMEKKEILIDNKFDNEIRNFETNNGLIGIKKLNFLDGINEIEYENYKEFFKNKSSYEMKLYFGDEHILSDIFESQIISIIEDKYGFSFEKFLKKMGEGNIGKGNYETFLIQLYGGFIGKYNKNLDGINNNGVKNVFSIIQEKKQFYMKVSEEIHKLGNCFDFDLGDGIDLNESGVLTKFLPIKQQEIKGEKELILDGKDKYENSIFELFKKAKFDKNQVINYLNGKNSNFDDPSNPNYREMLILNLQFYGFGTGDYTNNIDGKFGPGTKQIFEKLYDRIYDKIDIENKGLGGKLDFSDGLSKEEYETKGVKEYLNTLNVKTLESIKNYKDIFKLQILELIKISGVEELPNNQKLQKFKEYIKNNCGEYEIILIKLFGITNDAFSGKIDGIQDSGFNNILKLLFSENINGLNFGYLPNRSYLDSLLNTGNNFNIEGKPTTNKEKFQILNYVYEQLLSKGLIEKPLTRYQLIKLLTVMNNIGRIESTDNYGLLGVVIKNPRSSRYLGRAIGRYQLMHGHQEKSGNNSNWIHYSRIISGNILDPRFPVSQDLVAFTMILKEKYSIISQLNDSNTITRNDKIIFNKIGKIWIGGGSVDLGTGISSSTYAGMVGAIGSLENI